MIFFSGFCRQKTKTKPNMSRVDLRSLPHAQAAELAASFEAQNWTIVHDDACEGDTLLVLPSLAWVPGCVAAVVTLIQNSLIKCSV
jgi:hypothetical protein